MLLQHGTVLYSVDVERMFSLLKVPDEKIRDKLIATVKERVTSIKCQKEVFRNDAYEALLSGFTKEKEFQMESLTQKEIERADMLTEEKYNKKEWNCMR